VIRLEHANAGADEGFAAILEGVSLTEGSNDLRFERLFSGFAIPKRFAA
jgi:hypothetical protein